jgi:hypothetical protein
MRQLTNSGAESRLLPLCVAVFLGWRVRRVALVLGLALHLAIVVVIGLFTFGLAMAAALVLSMVRLREQPDVGRGRRAAARPTKEMTMRDVVTPDPLGVG